MRQIFARTCIVLGITAMVVVVSGCSGSEPGMPSPAGHTSSDKDPSSSGNATGTSTSDTATLDALDPCSLLNAGNRDDLGITTTGEKKKVGTARVCEWETSGGSLLIALRSNGGLDVVNDAGGTSTNTTVGNHDAKRKSGTALCYFFIGVTEHSRVDVQGVKDARPDCDLAKKAAEIIEPKLPSS